MPSYSGSSSGGSKPERYADPSGEPSARGPSGAEPRSPVGQPQPPMDGDYDFWRQVGSGLRAGEGASSVRPNSQQYRSPPPPPPDQPESGSNSQGQDPILVRIESTRQKLALSRKEILTETKRYAKLRNLSRFFGVCSFIVGGFSISMSILGAVGGMSFSEPFLFFMLALTGVFLLISSTIKVIKNPNLHMRAGQEALANLADLAKKVDDVKKDFEILPEQQRRKLRQLQPTVFVEVTKIDNACAALQRRFDEREAHYDADEDSTFTYLENMLRVVQVLKDMFRSAGEHPHNKLPKK